MAISPYTEPAEQPVVNTYAPVPFDDLYKLGEKVEARRTEAAENMQETYDDILEVNFIPNSTDQAKVQDISDEARTLIDEYSDTTKYDLSDKQTFADIKRKLTDLGNRKTLQNSQLSYDNWEKNQNVVRQLKANNKYHSALDLTGEGWDSDSQGIYEHTTDGLGERISHTYKIMDVQPLVGYDPNTGESYQRVTQGMIKKRAEEMAPGFARSSLGQAWVKAWRADNDNPMVDDGQGGQVPMGDAEIAYQMLLEDGQHWIRNEIAPPTAGWQKNNKSTFAANFTVNHGLSYFQGDGQVAGKIIAEAYGLQLNPKTGRYMDVLQKGSGDVINFATPISGIMTDQEKIATSSQPAYTKELNRSRSTALANLGYVMDDQGGFVQTDGAYEERPLIFEDSDVQSDWAFNATGFPSYRSDRYMAAGLDDASVTKNIENANTVIGSMAKKILAEEGRNLTDEEITEGATISTDKTAMRLPGLELPLLYMLGNHDITSPTIVSSSTHLTKEELLRHSAEVKRYPGTVEQQIHAMMEESRNPSMFKNGFMLVEGGYDQQGVRNFGADLSTRAQTIKRDSIYQDSDLAQKQLGNMSKELGKANALAKNIQKATGLDITDRNTATMLQRKQKEDMEFLGEEGYGKSMETLLGALAGTQIEMSFPALTGVKEHVGGNAYLDVTVTVPYKVMKSAFATMDEWGDEDDYTGSPFTHEWQEELIKGGDNDQIAFMTKSGAGTDDDPYMISFPLKRRIDQTRALMHSINKSMSGTAKMHLESGDYHDKMWDIQEWKQNVFKKALGNRKAAANSISKEMNGLKKALETTDTGLNEEQTKAVIDQIDQIKGMQDSDHKWITWYGFSQQLKYGSDARGMYQAMQSWPDLFVPSN